MTKLALQKRKPHPADKGRVLPWESCLPFLDNSRAVLIHRPRCVSTMKIFREPHLAVMNWCGNGFAGTRNLTFLSAPPDNKLLCERCEQAAVAAGLPSAFELAGRHVHTGRLVAVRTCCEAAKEQP